MFEGDASRSGRFITKLSTVLSQIVDLVYPPQCLICEDRLDHAARQICVSCLCEFKLIGRLHSDFSVSGEIHLDETWPLFEFDPAFQQLIHQLKYARRRKPLIVLLNFYEPKILGMLTEKPDLVISIPLHPRKLRERGYNQVDDMSRWLARQLETSFGDNVVKRTRYTKSQTKLSAQERQENVQGAFKLQDEDAVRDAHILLVDDVLTTGATANAVAGVLKGAGARKIILMTLSTPLHGSA